MVLSLSLYFNDRCLHISYKISSFNYNLISPLINIHFNFSKIFKLIYNKISKKRISGRKLFKLFHFPDPLDILSLVPFLFHFVFSAPYTLLERIARREGGAGAGKEGEGEYLPLTLPPHSHPLLRTENHWLDALTLLNLSFSVPYIHSLSRPLLRPS